MNKKLLIIPDERLRQKSEPVKNVDGYIHELSQFMLDQLEPQHAAGFAAPQFGELVQVFVARLYGLEIVLINPTIIKQSKTHLVTEGCKSIPNKLYAVKRPKIVKVKGIDLNGEVKTVKGHDFLAQVLCHETDHLHGILIDSIGGLVDYE